MPNCPGSNGCRCSDHHPGLGAYAQDPIAYEAMLRRLRPTTLSVVTMGAGPVDHDPARCERMVCDDPACIAQNASRVAQGSGNANPIKVRNAA